MKGKLSLAIAFLVGAISFSIMASTTNAQAGGGDAVGDTGLITLGPTEFLRITVTAKGREASSPSVSEIVVTKRGYATPVCTENEVCTRDVLFDSQGTCDLLRGKACSFDIDSSFQGLTASGIQAQIFASRPNRIVVTALVIDRITRKTGHVTIAR